MIYTVRILLVLLLLVVFKSEAHADTEKFKDTIWKDCGVARAEAEKFTAAERLSAVTFLNGIVTLNLASSENSLPVNPGIIKAPDGVLSDVSLAQSLDPDRSNRAKKCAAELLLILVPESGMALPALIEQSEDSKVNIEVRAAFSRVAYGVALAMSTQAVVPGPDGSSVPTIPDSLMDQLYELYLKSPSTLAEEVLLLFPDALIARIGATLISSGCVLDCSVETRLTELLSRIDLRSAAGKEAVIRIVEQVRPEIRVMLLHALQYSSSLYEAVLVFILDRLEDSGSPERAQYFDNLNTIFNYELRTASLAVNPEKRYGLILLFDFSSESERDILEKGLAVVAPLSPDISEQLKILYKSKDPDLRARAARLLSRIIVPDKHVKQAMAQLLADPVVDVQQVALESSLAGTDSKIFLGYAKAIRENIERSRKTAVIDDQKALDARIALLRSVSLFSDLELSKEWIQFALEVIEAGLIQKVNPPELSAALNVLQSSSKNALSQIRLYSRSREASKRAAAVFVMSRGIVQDPAVFEALLTMLADTDTEVAKAAQLSLLAVSPDLRELLNEKRQMPPSPRLDELTLEAGLKPELEREVQNRFSIIDCSEIADVASVCLLRQGSGAFCSVVAGQIPRCIDSGVLAALPTGAIEKAIRVQPGIRDIFQQALFDSQTTPSAQMEIGLFMLRAQAGNEQVISRMCELSHIASDSAVSEIISYASLDLLSVKNCLDSLKKQFESGGLKASQRALLFKSILKLDPQAINTQVMLKDALERDDLEFLRILAKAELVNELLPMLGEILSTANTVSYEQDRLIALQLVEELGEKAVTQMPVLKPLLESQSNDVRYAAARAIIAINSDQPLSIRALRTILNSPKLRDLLLKPDLNALSSLVDLLSADSAANLTNLEKRNLQRVQRAIHGPEAVIAEPIEETVTVAEGSENLP